MTGNAAYTGLFVDLLPKLFLAAGLPADRFQYYTAPLNAAGLANANGSFTGSSFAQCMQTGHFVGHFYNDFPAPLLRLRGDPRCNPMHVQR